MPSARRLRKDGRGSSSSGTLSRSTFRRCRPRCPKKRRRPRSCPRPWSRPQPRCLLRPWSRRRVKPRKRRRKTSTGKFAKWWFAAQFGCARRTPRMRLLTGCCGRWCGRNTSSCGGTTIRQRSATNIRRCCRGPRGMCGLSSRSPKASPPSATQRSRTTARSSLAPIRCGWICSAGSSPAWMLCRLARPAARWFPDFPICFRGFLSCRASSGTAADFWPARRPRAGWKASPRLRTRLRTSRWKRPTFPRVCVRACCIFRSGRIKRLGPASDSKSDSRWRVCVWWKNASISPSRSSIPY